MPETDIDYLVGAGYLEEVKQGNGAPSYKLTAGSAPKLAEAIRQCVLLGTALEAADLVRKKAEAKAKETEEALEAFAKATKDASSRAVSKKLREQASLFDQVLKGHEKETRKLSEQRETISRERDEIATAKTEVDKQVGSLKLQVDTLLGERARKQADTEQQLQEARKCHHTKLVDALVETNPGWWQFLLKRSEDELRVSAQLQKILHELSIVKTIENR